MSRINPNAPGPTLIGSFQDATVNGNTTVTSKDTSKKWYQNDYVVYGGIALVLFVVMFFVFKK